MKALNQEREEVTTPLSVLRLTEQKSKCGTVSAFIKGRRKNLLIMILYI